MLSSDLLFNWHLRRTYLSSGFPIGSRTSCNELSLSSIISFHLVANPLTCFYLLFELKKLLIVWPTLFFFLNFWRPSCQKISSLSRCFLVSLWLIAQRIWMCGKPLLARFLGWNPLGQRGLGCVLDCHRLGKPLWSCLCSFSLISLLMNYLTPTTWY